MVVAVIAAVALLAAPALAWNGYRADYTTTEACQTCHQTALGGMPPVYQQWLETKHAEANSEGQSSRLPYGSSCAGCHTANYHPGKVTPVPTATSGTGSVSWGPSPTATTLPQTQGDAPFSEPFVGCSACHYGANVGGGLAIYGVDENDTAHMAPYGLLANADICGQCHSRYSYTRDTYAVKPIPTPTAVPTTLLQPQYAIGFAMLGQPSPYGGWQEPASLGDHLHIPSPGWTPTPNPAATSPGLARLQTFWKDADGNDLPWQQTGHDGNAAQYPEWLNEGHARALTGLTSQPFWGFLPETTKQRCLECHSADFRIMKEAGMSPTSSDVRYGVTCVGCHTPHEAGTARGVWDEELTPQVRGDSLKTLCVECHNSELPEGEEASPGQEIHHPMKEMMEGYGAIDVDGMPSVHKGKCVQCHMPPTMFSRGSVQLGANHTFQIIEPEVAAEASPIPVRTTTPSPGATQVTYSAMPYSACSTCHGKTSDPLATYLQDTIEDRQDWTHRQVEAIWADLDTAAQKLGFADAEAAHAQIMTVPEDKWTANQLSFLKGFTNVEFVQSEGSWGIHNWQYTVAIVAKARQQARAVTSDPWVVTLKRSRATVLLGRKVRFSGTVTTSSLVPGTGSVVLQRKKAGGTWKTWATVPLGSGGAYTKALKMTSRGTFYFRAFMPADASDLAAYSRTVKVVVR